MAAPFPKSGCVSFLAPMQDITDYAFMRIIDGFGSPDYAVTEYIRIHQNYELDADALMCATKNACGKAVAVQFIGENENYLRSAIRDLAKMRPRVEMLDLNIGCPAPKVYRKNVGGGLLREPEKIGELCRLFRSEWEGCFSVKMRLGFDSAEGFEDILGEVLSGNPDFLTIHARTVKQLYRGEPDYSKIAKAARMCKIPVIANGDILSARSALDLAGALGCAGVMIGRAAVRNPWIFRQIAQLRAGENPFVPLKSDVREYIEKLRTKLFANCRYPDAHMKKYLNFVGTAVDPRGEFLANMRLARGMDALLKVCDTFLLGAHAGEPFADTPYANLCARPNHEGVLKSY